MAKNLIDCNTFFIDSDVYIRIGLDLGLYAQIWTSPTDID